MGRGVIPHWCWPLTPSFSIPVFLFCIFCWLIPHTHIIINHAVLCWWGRLFYYRCSKGVEMQSVIHPWITAYFCVWNGRDGRKSNFPFIVHMTTSLHQVMSLIRDSDCRFINSITWISDWDVFPKRVENHICSLQSFPSTNYIKLTHDSFGFGIHR